MKIIGINKRYWDERSNVNSVVTAILFILFNAARDKYLPNPLEL